MKKLQNLFLLLMLALVPVAFTACGNDDSDDKKTDTPNPTAYTLPTSGTVTYSMKFTNFSDQEIYTKEVKFTFNGTEVTVRGLSDYLPDSLIVGQISGNVITLPECRLGTYQRSEYMMPMVIDFMGATFQYDSTTGILFSKEGFYTLSNKTPIDHFINITLKPIVEKAAKPAKPMCRFRRSDYGTMFQLEINIPLYDINDEPMLSDKLSYVVLVEKDGQTSEITFEAPLYKYLTEPMTEIPYNYTDLFDIDNYNIYMNFGEEEMKTWTSIAVQSIYRGGGQVNKSDINWFDMESFWENDSKNK